MSTQPQNQQPTLSTQPHHTINQQPTISTQPQHQQHEMSPQPHHTNKQQPTMSTQPQNQQPTMSTQPQNQQPTMSTQPQNQQPTMSTQPQNQQPTMSTQPQNQQPTMSTQPQNQQPTMSTQPQNQQPTMSTQPQNQQPTMSTQPQNQQPTMSTQPQNQQSTMSTQPQNQQPTMSTQPQNQQPTMSTQPHQTISEHSRTRARQHVGENGRSEEGLAEEQNRYGNSGAIEVGQGRGKHVEGEDGIVMTAGDLGRTESTPRTTLREVTAVGKTRERAWYHTRRPETVFHGRTSRWPYVKPTWHTPTSNPQEARTHMNHKVINHEVHYWTRAPTLPRHQQTEHGVEESGHGEHKVGQTTNHDNSLMSTIDKDNEVQQSDDNISLKPTTNRGDAEQQSDDGRQRTDKKPRRGADSISQADLYAVLRKDAEAIKDADPELYQRIQHHLSQWHTEGEETAGREPGVKDDSKQETIWGKHFLGN